MRHEDKRAFGEIMAVMGENFGKQLSHNAIGMWFTALEKFSLEDVRLAAMSILRTRKYSSMPTLAEMLEHLDGGDPETLGLIQATQVRNAVATYGAYASVVFDDPVTQAVIQDVYGGWAALCEDAREDKRDWQIREFVRHYVAFRASGRRLHGHLAGIAERHNSAHCAGRCLPAPVLVGNPEVARQVLALGQEAKTLPLAAGDESAAAEVGIRAGHLAAQVLAAQAQAFRQPIRDDDAIDVEAMRRDALRALEASGVAS